MTESATKTEAVVLSLRNDTCGALAESSKGFAPSSKPPQVASVDTTFSPLVSTIPASAQAEDIVSSVASTMAMMTKFMGDMHMRMGRLEVNVFKIQTAAETVLSASSVANPVSQISAKRSVMESPKHSPTQSVRPPSPPSCPRSPASLPNSHHRAQIISTPSGSKSSESSSIPTPAPSDAVLGRTFTLRLPELETTWYADRPFPAFQVSVVDSATGDPFTSTEGWVVVLHLLDGHGCEVDSKLGCGEWTKRIVLHQGGVATIAGVRFSAVSSKNGGFFQLQFQLFPTHRAVPSVVLSPPITVLSTRLFHSPKTSFEKLQPTDCLSKMPGIGKMYAQRFLVLGVSTIHHLANMDISQLSSEEQATLLECLRREKGTMTRVKLEEYISHARDVVTRCGQSITPTPPQISAITANVMSPSSQSLDPKRSPFGTSARWSPSLLELNSGSGSQGSDGSNSSGGNMSLPRTVSPHVTPLTPASMSSISSSPSVPMQHSHSTTSLPFVLSAPVPSPGAALAGGAPLCRKRSASVQLAPLESKCVKTMAGEEGKDEADGFHHDLLANATILLECMREHQGRERALTL